MQREAVRVEGQRVPRAVVFDLGKVLLDFDYGIAIRRMLPFTRVDAPALHALINQSTLLHHYESGRMGTTEFFAHVREATGFEGDQDRFASMFGDIFREISPMVELQAEVRARGYPTYILSNTNELAITHIRRLFPFFGTFDGYALSYEHGSMKPEAHLYEVIEAMAGMKGEDLFYLDDRPENIVPARARQWQAHVHVDPASSRQALMEAGVLDRGRGPE